MKLEFARRLIGYLSFWFLLIGFKISKTEFTKFQKLNYSSTTRVPDIPEWPDPQKTEQKNVNVPALSAVNSTIVSFPGSMLAFTLKSGRPNPCVTSVLVIVSLT